MNKKCFHNAFTQNGLRVDDYRQEELKLLPAGQIRPPNFKCPVKTICVNYVDYILLDQTLISFFYNDTKKQLVDERSGRKPIVFSFTVG